MQPTSPILASDREPNLELLRSHGWFLGTQSGPYCVAWRGRDEVVFEWRTDAWHRIGGRGGDMELM